MLKLHSGEQKRFATRGVVDFDLLTKLVASVSAISEVDVHKCDLSEVGRLEKFLDIISHLSADTLRMTHTIVNCNCGKRHTIGRHTHNQEISIQQGCSHPFTRRGVADIFSKFKTVDLEGVGMSLRFPQLHELDCFERLSDGANVAGVVSLDLSNNKMSVEGYNALISALNKNPSLKQLSLRNCLKQYANEGLITVSCLVVPKHVTHLDLTGCRDIVAHPSIPNKSYITRLVSESTLISLKLNEIHIYVPEERASIMDALAANTTLEVFAANCFNFDINHLAKVLETNGTLCTITLGCHFLPNDAYIIPSLDRLRNATNSNTTVELLTTMFVSPRVSGIIRELIGDMNSRNTSLFNLLFNYCGKFKFKMTPDRKRPARSIETHTQRQRTQ